MRYFHDAERQTVYQVNDRPTLAEKTACNDRHVSWTVATDIAITRADNQRTGDGNWLHPTAIRPRQIFEARHSQDESLALFWQAHLPAGEEISAEAYERLRAQYECNPSASSTP